MCYSNVHHCNSQGYKLYHIMPGEIYFYPCGRWFEICGRWLDTWGVWFETCGVWFETWATWLETCGVWFEIWATWFDICRTWFDTFTWFHHYISFKVNLIPMIIWYTVTPNNMGHMIWTVKYIWETSLWYLVWHLWNLIWFLWILCIILCWSLIWTLLALLIKGFKNLSHVRWLMYGSGYCIVQVEVPAWLSCFIVSNPENWFAA